MLQHNFLFNFLSSKKNFLACCTRTDSNTQWKNRGSDHNSLLLIKPFLNLELLVNLFDIATPENCNDPENVSSSKYYDLSKKHNIKIPLKSLSLFHMYVFSLKF